MTTTTSFEILVGKDRDKEFIDNNVWNYTDFQIEFMLELMDRDLFEHFVTHGHQVPMAGWRRGQGPVSLLWYEDGILNGIRLGTNEIKCATMRAVT